MFGLDRIQPKLSFLIGNVVKGSRSRRSRDVTVKRPIPVWLGTQPKIMYLFSKERDVAPWYDPLSYFPFQLVLHNWCNKGRGMCNPVCRMVHIKAPLLLIGKSSPCGGSGFPLSLSVVLYHMSDAILPQIKCVECVVK